MDTSDSLRKGRLYYLQSWAKIAVIPSSKFMEEAVLRILSVYIESYPVMKKFWKSTILPRLELLLEAAKSTFETRSSLSGKRILALLPLK